MKLLLLTLPSAPSLVGRARLPLQPSASWLEALMQRLASIEYLAQECQQGLQTFFSDQVASHLLTCILNYVLYSGC